jgi:Domain of unknown function (DUF4167)
VNNNFMRSNQNKNNNNNRNRNRNNNRRNTGTGGGGGGSGNNKVFDSNGPDIKLRGTTQTIAEKYMQLGRDAQSSGDGVAAENYYQHAEHYYRLWAANQPVGHSLQMSRRLGEEEFEEEGEDQASGDEEGEQGSVDATPVEGVAQGDVDPNAGQADGQQPRQNRNNNYRDNNNNRDTNNRNFRPRWQNNRNNRTYDNRDGVPPVADQNGLPPAEVAVEHVQATPVTPVAEHEGQWEAPSFLQRPSIAVAEAPELAGPAEAAPRKYRPRKPKVEAEAAPEAKDSSASNE